MLSLTKGGSAEAYVKGAFNGDIAAILRRIHRGMLQLVGFDVLTPQIVYGPVHLTDEHWRQQLADREGLPALRSGHASLRCAIIFRGRYERPPRSNPALRQGSHPSLPLYVLTYLPNDFYWRRGREQSRK